jgi:hypothetical protein
MLAGWALLSSPRLASVYVGVYVEPVPQVTLYIDEETRARMKAAAKAAGVSVSRWVADLIRARTRAEWPASVRELAGDPGGMARFGQPEANYFPLTMAVASML